MTSSRTQTALDLADEALAELEAQGNLLAPIVLKCLRLAGLLDHPAAADWFRCELRGYRDSVPVKPGWATYAIWSGREASLDPATNQQRYWTAPIEELEAELQITLSDLQSLQLSPVAVSESGSAQSGAVGALPTASQKIINSIAARRAEKADLVRRYTRIRACLRGAMQDWLSRSVVELRYGSIIETSFERVRMRFDSFLSNQAPEVGRRLAAAYQRAYSDDPEEWSQALTSCRRALKALADEIYPPTDETKGGHELTDDKYRNRLIQFSTENIDSSSQEELLEAEIDSVVSRVEALDALASKGVHADVNERDLELAIVRTYLLAGDLLSLVSSPDDTIATAPPAVDAEAAPEPNASGSQPTEGPYEPATKSTRTDDGS